MLSLTVIVKIMWEVILIDWYAVSEICCYSDVLTTAGKCQERHWTEYVVTYCSLTVWSLSHTVYLTHSLSLYLSLYIFLSLPHWIPLSLSIPHSAPLSYRTKSSDGQSLYCRLNTSMLEISPPNQSFLFRELVWPKYAAGMSFLSWLGQLGSQFIPIGCHSWWKKDGIHLMERLLFSVSVYSYLP